MTYQPGYQDTALSQVINYFDDKLLQKQPFGPISIFETGTKRINWNNQVYELAQAILTVEAHQGATSGAAVIPKFNDRSLDPIRWQALETQEKTQDYDVTDVMFNGANTLKLEYQVTGYQLLATEAYVTADLKLVWFKIDPDAPYDNTPADQGETKDPNSWSKFVNSLKDNVKTIVIISAIVGTVVTVGYVYTRGNPIKILSKIGR